MELDEVRALHHQRVREQAEEAYGLTGDALVAELVAALDRAATVGVDLRARKTRLARLLRSAGHTCDLVLKETGS